MTDILQKVSQFATVTTGCTENNDALITFVGLDKLESFLASEKRELEEKLTLVNRLHAIEQHLREEAEGKIAVLKNMFESVWSVIPKETFFDAATIESANAKLADLSQSVEAWRNGVKAEALEEFAHRLETCESAYPSTVSDYAEAARMMAQELKKETK